MRIGIDARFAVHDRRGIGNYTLNLIQNLARLDTENQYVLYVDREDKGGVLPHGGNFTTIVVSPSNYFIWEQIMLPMRAKRDGIQLMHCTGNTAPVFWSKKLGLVTTIHDVMFLKKHSELSMSPSLYQRLGRLYRKITVPRTIGHVSMVLTVSKFSMRDILANLPELPSERIRVTYEAANESFRPVEAAVTSATVRKIVGTNDPYILVLGAIDPRKNTDMVLRKYIELKGEGGIREKLAVAGVPNWRQTRFAATVEESGYGEDIIFPGYVSDEELVHLYNGATVFLYPSSYEGFGIPLLEAMACGTPVIASNAASVPEIAGGAALCVDSTNQEEFKTTLLRVLRDQALRSELAQRGLKRASRFSWSRMSMETLAIYREIGNPSGARGE